MHLHGRAQPAPGPGHPRIGSVICRLGAAHLHDAAGLPGTIRARYRLRAGFGSGAGGRLAQAERAP